MADSSKKPKGLSLTMSKPSSSSTSSFSSSEMSATPSQSNVGTCAAEQHSNPAVSSPPVPEDVWRKFIREHYPNLQGETYFLPPLHFRRVPHSVVTIGGQTVRVVENPPCQRQPRRRYHPRWPPQQVAGTVFIDNPPTLKPVHVLNTDLQEDEAIQRCLGCLQTLSDNTSQVMMVLSQLKFRQYLDNKTNPEKKTNLLHATAIACLPAVTSLPDNIAEGECDILIIHRQHGFVIGEMKSLGASQRFSNLPDSDQDQDLIKVVEKAVTQLKNQETALRHLVFDLNGVRASKGVAPITIIKTLLMPNISSGQLQRALTHCTRPSLQQELLQCLGSADVTQAVGKCLCADHMEQPVTWWNNTVLSQSADPGMSDDVYERLVARFCGPATTVEVATPSPPRKAVVVRSMGQAVAETGLRFSSLALTPQQVAILNKVSPEPRYVYLQGPPGCGKTIVLALKALQWLKQDRRVCIVSTSSAGRAVSALLEHQVRSSLGAAAAEGQFQRLDYDFRGSSGHVSRAVSDLEKLAQPTARLAVIMDEITQFGMDDFNEFIRQVSTCPAASTMCVWAAGMYVHSPARQQPHISQLPHALHVETLNTALRRPPSVTNRVQRSDYIIHGLIPPYSAPAQPVPTNGPAVRELHHKDQPGHTGDHPLDCKSCADSIAGILTELGVDQSGSSLQYRDVFILSGQDRPPSNNDVMIRCLMHLSLPVRVMTSPLSDTDASELGLAINDHVVVADVDAVRGLERRVVIVLVYSSRTNTLHMISRCTGSLYIIDPRDMSPVFASDSSSDDDVGYRLPTGTVYSQSGVQVNCVIDLLDRL